VISREQLKAHIRKKAKELSLNSNMILRHVTFDFFLEKLAKTMYANCFIIKGGFLVSASTMINLRTTMDIDITLKSLSMQKDDLSKYIIDILTTPTRDLLVMNLIGIEEIHSDADYPGYRASIAVDYDGFKEVIKIDFTTGDQITPREVNFMYKTMIDEQIIGLKSYNLETVLAEKMETIFSRGVLNTRIRDFYDVYILWHLKECHTNKLQLQQAFMNTAKYRKSLDIVLPNIHTIIDTIEIDNRMIQL
jgi:predicted nucleotidyltransferase component of viral defense system